MVRPYVFGALLLKIYFTYFYRCVFICGRHVYLNTWFIVLYYSFELIFYRLYVNKLCCQSQELSKVCIAVITRVILGLSVQGQVGRGFEQPDLLEGVPGHSRGAGSGSSLRSFPTQSVLWFCDWVLRTNDSSVSVWGGSLWEIHPPSASSTTPWPCISWGGQPYVRRAVSALSTVMHFSIQSIWGLTFFLKYLLILQSLTRGKAPCHTVLRVPGFHFSHILWTNDEMLAAVPLTWMG